jgi:hypothetical protein
MIPRNQSLNIHHVERRALQLLSSAHPKPPVSVPAEYPEMRGSSSAC